MQAIPVTVDLRTEISMTMGKIGQVKAMMMQDRFLVTFRDPMPYCTRISFNKFLIYCRGHSHLLQQIKGLWRITFNS